MTDAPRQVQRLLGMLRGAGFRAVLVGGSVRDLLRGEAPSDWDIATSAYPEELVSLFATERTLTTGLRHGTITVIDEHLPIEITSFRADGDYSDGRRPDQVSFTRSLEEDLARRDFTINALCVDEQGETIDLFDGQGDLSRRIIRCIGDPDRRFAEDALRIWRALRFAAALGFAIEEKTAQAIHRNLHRLSWLSSERVLSELSKLLCAAHCQTVLCDFPDVLCCCFAPLRPLVPRHQAGESSRYEQAACAVANVPPVLALRLAALLAEVQSCEERAQVYAEDVQPCKREAQTALECLAALRCSKALQQQVASLLRQQHLSLESDRAALRKLVASHTVPFLRDLAALQRARWIAAGQYTLSREEALGRFGVALQALERERPALTLAALAIDGNDLQGMGVPAGKRIGALLSLLLQEVIEERLPNEREALLLAAARFLLV